MDWQDLIAVVKERRVYIQTHDYPDPDALASAFALQTLLQFFQIPSQIGYGGSIGTRSTLMMIKLLGMKAVPVSELTDMEKNDCIINVDSQMGNSNITSLPGQYVACIDHHPLVGKHPYLYQDVRYAGSCSTLVAGYFRDANVPVPEKVATALLYGIHIDTNQLRRGLTELDVEMYHFLYPRGDGTILNQLLSSKLELSDLKAFGAAINDVRIVGQVGFACIPFDCPDALLGMVSDFILSLDVVNFSVVYTKRPGGWKVSVRCADSGLHAGQIIKEVAESFHGGGGGHAEMAAGFIPWKEEAQDDWEAELRTRFLNTIQKYESI